jgi:hypothetical protein
LNDSFNTLPSALYLIAERTPKNISVVRISNVGQNDKSFSENFLGDFFNHPEQDIYTISSLKKEQSTPTINVQAIIRAEAYIANAIHQISRASFSRQRRRRSNMDGHVKSYSVKPRII